MSPTLPTSASTTRTPSGVSWGLALVAGILGAFMLMYYVQLLHDAVERGHQWRFSQSSQTSQVASRPVVEASARSGGLGLNTLAEGTRR